MFGKCHLDSLPDLDTLSEVWAMYTTTCELGIRSPTIQSGNKGSVRLVNQMKHNRDLRFSLLIPVE